MKRKFQKVAVLMGGNSPEREVSLKSGQKVHQALAELGYNTKKVDPSKEQLPSDIDAAYIALHGEGGEDGTIQGVLTHKNIPYTGPKVLGCSLSMNKIITKQILSANNIRTPEYEILESSDTKLEFPLIIKPACGGSSIGVSIVRNQAELTRIYEKMKDNYNELLVEKYIKGCEITVGIIEIDNHLEALPILQLLPENEFYDYEAKYTRGMTEFILPARLAPETEKKAKEIAVKTFKALKCSSVSRIDMIVDHNDNIYVIENNTSPGMTDLSDLPAQAREHGISYNQLVNMIMESASL